jgi:hypothetical protein
MRVSIAGPGTTGNGQECGPVVTVSQIWYHRETRVIKVPLAAFALGHRRFRGEG